MKTGSSNKFHLIRTTIAVLLLLLLMSSSESVWAESTFAWKPDKTITFGDTGRLAPGLEFASGYAGLWSTSTDVHVTQNLPDVTFSSPAGGGFIDLGAVPYDKVPPLNGDLARELPAVTGHVYLYFKDSMVVKFQVARITKGTEQYSMPTVTLKYATGTLDLFEVLPDASSYSFGEVAPQPQPQPQPLPQPQPQPKPQTPVSFTWKADKTISVGDTGRLAPGLTFSTGYVGLWSTSADLYVTQDLPTVTLSSPAGGGFIDLGAVPYDKVPPLNGDLKRELPAVTSHVYLYFKDNLVAKFQVVRIVKGQEQYDMPNVTLKYAIGTLDPATVLPDAASYDFNAVVTQPEPQQPQTPAGSPAIVKAVFQDGAVVLTWTAAYPAPSKGYYVYRGTTQDFTPATPQMDFPTLQTTYTDTKVTAGSTYYYIVEAIGGGQSQVVKVEATAPAQQPVTTRVIRMTLNSKTAYINNVRRELDVAPQTIEDRMMVPLRVLGEALGAAVDFDASANKVTYSLDGRTLLLWLNQRNASLNGIAKAMDVPPTLVSDRTMIPLRFVSEALGASVDFDAATSTATISYTPQSQPVAQPSTPTSSIPETPLVDSVADMIDYSTFYGKWKVWMSGNFSAPDSYGYSTYMPGGNVGFLNLYQDGTFVWEISGNPYKQGTWGAHPSGNGNLILDVDTGSMFADYSMKMNDDGTIEFWSFDLKHTGTRVE